MRSPAALRVVEPVGSVDIAAAERAAADLLAALGIELDSESLEGTPARMARAYAELLAPRPFDLTTFPNDEGYDELVLARDIPVRSLCEHHLLPFAGVAHVGYLPGTRILGLSRSGSPSRWPTGLTITCSRAASVWSSRPSTAA
jgi:GTP cyclohydrolase IA